MYSQLYSKNNIGIPPQKIKFFVELNSYESSISEDYYDKIRSTTYKCLDEKCPKTNSKINDFILKDNKGYMSQETFELNPDNKLDEFIFLLKPKGKNDSESLPSTNTIGFGLEDKKIKSLSFMDQLKKHNYIDKKIFTPLTDENSVNENRFFDAYILMGCLPHKVHPLFEEKDLKWISNKDTIGSNKNWHINFDWIKYNNDIIKDRLAYLDLSLNVIIGPEGFRQKIINQFLKSHLERKKCTESLFYNLKDEQHYIFYSCENDAEFIDIPKLTFYSKALNESFEITFDKLFSQYRHRFYFNIIFNKKAKNNWVLGQIFLNNYRFVFDSEEERVGYYKTQIPENHPFIAIICIIVALLIFFIFYLNGNRFNMGNQNIFENQQIQKNIYQAGMQQSTNIQNNINESGGNINKKGNKKTKED